MVAEAEAKAESGQASAAGSSRRMAGRVARWVVLLAALMAFARYAYVRIITPPSRPAGLSAGGAVDEKPQPGDCTQELNSLLSAIPQFNPANPSGSSNPIRTRRMRRASDLMSVVRGKWNTELPEVEEAIEYLDSTGVQAFMASLDTLQPRPFEMDTFDFGRGNVVTAIALRQVIPLLAAEARYATESGDAVRAWRSLRVMFWLVDETQSEAQSELGLSDLGVAWGSAEDFLGRAQTEAGDAAHRLSLDESVRREWNSWLAARPRMSQAWPAKMERMRREATRMVDGSFTLDEDGNGWLVVSSQTTSLWWSGSWALSGFGGVSDKRSRLWNVFSAVYNDRRPVTRKMDELLTTVAELQDVAHMEARNRIERVRTGRAGGFNALDGPLFGSMLTPEVFGSQLQSDYESMKRIDTVGDGVRIMLALRAYRDARGEFPQSLGDLSPQWLDPVPVDPFSAEEFLYDRRGDDYILYSVGYDGEDDGGRSGGRRYWRRMADYDHVDIVLTDLRQ